MKKVIIIGMLLFLSMGSNVLGANECASNLSDDLKLHIPVARLADDFYLLDFQYVSTTDGLIWLKLINANASTLSQCSNPSLIVFNTDNIMLHVPLIFWGTTSFWLDLEYVPTTDGYIWVKVKNYNPMSNWVFVTSVSGNGNLGSWADAGGKTGLEAGDAICQARANAAGLNGTYKAWLSDDNDDAYCRIHNLSGKKSNNCGQGTLPVAAGPWVRTDGFPFGETIDKIVNHGQIYTPPIVNEFGEGVGRAYYFTGTEIDGTSITTVERDCSNWTSNEGTGEVGSAFCTTGYWSAITSSYCDNTHRLLCFQTGSGLSLPYYTSTGKKIFVTSVTGTGDLGSWADAGGKTGLAAGDAICQARAEAAGLTGTFRAWLSDDSINAIDRLISDGPWVRLDGVKVADNKVDLTDGSLFTSINITETGVYIMSDAWTGTSLDGTKNNETCNNWTDQTEVLQGLYGCGTSVFPWTQCGLLDCKYNMSLFCFED